MNLMHYKQNFMNLRFSLIAFFLLFIGNVVAQDYVVSYDSTAYVSLSTFETVNESNPEFDAIGDELYQKIPIGFTYNIEGESFDSLMVCESGYVLFRSGSIEKSYISIFDSPLKNFDDMPEASPIVYNTSGTDGNQIFILEFINVGFLNDSENNDSANFQLWLYESCSDFEVHIGPLEIESSEDDLFYNMNPSPILGYGNYETSEFYALSGEIESPELVSSIGSSLNILPPNGSVFNFTKCQVGIPDENSGELSIFPNPTNGSVVLQFENFYHLDLIQILNQQGQVVESFKGLSRETVNIDLTSFESGLYIVKAMDGNSTITRRLIKQ